MSENEQLLENGQDDHELKPSSNKYRSLKYIQCRQLMFGAVVTLWKLFTSGILLLLLLCWAYGGFLPIVLLILAVIGVFYCIQDSLLYYPEQPPSARLYVEMPSLMNMPYEKHFVTTQDRVRINLVFVKHSQESAPTVIFFHGNAGNIGHRLPNTFGLFCGCGCNVLLVEYRGYGRSGGNPSESGLYLDAEAAMDFISQRTDIDKNRIFLFGRSLGGAVAIYLASHSYYSRFLAGLILENTFTSLPDIGRKIFDFKILELLPDWCFKSKYPSKIKIQKINIPTMFLSGQKDTLIPPRMMEVLHSLSHSHLKRMVHFPDGTHNETWICPGYYESIASFINEVLNSRLSRNFASLESSSHNEGITVT